jgi:hypothetical protein
VEVCESFDVLTPNEIAGRIGDSCDAAIGQLTEDWNADLFATLAAAGGTAYSNYAVGYNNVDVAGATAAGIPVGNTPGVLTETTAEMAVCADVRGRAPSRRGRPVHAFRPLRRMAPNAVHGKAVPRAYGWESSEPAELAPPTLA